MKLEAKIACAEPEGTAEMLEEPVSAIAIPSMPPMTISIVASVTMNDGSFVRTTMNPFTAPIAARTRKASATPTQGLSE